jgi:hypothetical protein
VDTCRNKNNQDNTHINMNELQPIPLTDMSTAGQVLDSRSRSFSSVNLPALQSFISSSPTSIDDSLERIETRVMEDIVIPSRHRTTSFSSPTLSSMPSKHYLTAINSRSDIRQEVMAHLNDIAPPRRRPSKIINLR